MQYGCLHIKGRKQINSIAGRATSYRIRLLQTAGVEVVILKVRLCQQSRRFA